MPTLSFKKATKITSIKHNNRDFSPEDKLSPFHNHIDFSKTADNITLEQVNIHTKYQEIFGEAVREYNAKQKRKDRKIDDYYSKVRHDKNLEPQREFIIEFGNVEDIKSGRINSIEANRMLKEYYRGFVERNPNLVVYNAVIHNDEAVPHLHLNVIPVAHGYKRGMQVQPSFNKALRQQGYQSDPHDSRKIWRNFRETEVKAMSDILQEHGLEREFGKTNHIKTIHDYKAIMKAKHSELVQEVEEISKGIDDIQATFDERKEELRKFDEQEVGSDIPTLQRIAKSGKKALAEKEEMELQFKPIEKEAKLGIHLIKSFMPDKDSPERPKFVSKVIKGSVRYSSKTVSKVFKKLFEDDSERQQALRRYEMLQKKFIYEYRHGAYRNFER
ncbi:recombinase [Lactobacillus sp. XV13L]|nr:recombinase [Lactobacillus sp. XV13L]